MFTIRPLNRLTLKKCILKRIKLKFRGKPVKHLTYSTVVRRIQNYRSRYHYESEKCKLCVQGVNEIHVGKWRYSIYMDENDLPNKILIEIPKVCIPNNEFEDFCDKSSWEIKIQPPSLKSIASAVIINNTHILSKDIDSIIKILTFDASTKVLTYPRPYRLEDDDDEHNLLPIILSNVYAFDNHIIPYFPVSLYYKDKCMLLQN